MKNSLAIYGSSTSLARADELDVLAFKERAAKIRAVSDEVQTEVARIGAHGIVTSAELVQGAEALRMNLLEDGVRSQVYEDGSAMLLQVTIQNIINYTKAAQQVVIAHGMEMKR